tara:strand:- start:730 stop:1467 length:738 start_codon:yes stop_codon:yes gene_type:complete
MSKLRVLDLFSGIGGFSLGLERTGGFETVAFCEIDPFCQKVLAKHWPEVSVYDDIATLEYRGAVDLVTAGFPCQDISQAGKRAGLAGERSGLFWHVIRTVCMVGRPKLLLENVADLLDRGMGAVLGALAQVGYDTQWNCFPASAVGAPHSRDRVWIVADPSEAGQQGRHLDWDAISCVDTTEVARLGNARAICGPEWAGSFQDVRLGNGLPLGLVRSIVGACGNSVIPQIPEMIGNAILEAEKSA